MALMQRINAERGVNASACAHVEKGREKLVLVFEGGGEERTLLTLVGHEEEDMELSILVITFYHEQIRQQWYLVYLDSQTFGIDEVNCINDDSHGSLQKSCDAAAIKMVLRYLLAGGSGYASTDFFQVLL
ncbi:hypothetical protein ZIOFF_051185 [Zingiber officinale]|uniref:Uncharacterized protein n=1 Tax=Zingiber officinale TaxID=94328 RepID=A0A8J5KQV3_ZINOF|nr:hypothetical protein ZIOFF_051185 [Zingiber officinale]